MVQVKIASVVFLGENEYFSDAAQAKSIVYNPRVPFSLYSADNATLASIYNAGGGSTVKIAGQEIVEGQGNIICSDTSDVKPRRLVFTNRAGQSLTVPVETQDDLAETANSARELLNATAFAPVVCIQLVGERIKDLFTDFGGNFNGVPATVENNSKFATGNIDYELDTGNRVTLPVKIASPDGIVPAANVAQSFNACTEGGLLPTFPCGNRGQRITPRKFIAQYLIGNNVGGENIASGVASNEIPTVTAADDAIQTCAQDIITGVDGLFCLPYEGESDLRFHLRQGIGLGQ